MGKDYGNSAYCIKYMEWKLRELFGDSVIKTGISGTASAFALQNRFYMLFIDNGVKTARL